MADSALRVSDVEVTFKLWEQRRRRAGWTVLPAFVVMGAGIALGVGLQLVGVLVGGCLASLGLFALGWLPVMSKDTNAFGMASVVVTPDHLTLEGKERTRRIPRSALEGAWADDTSVTFRLVSGEDVVLEKLGDAALAERALSVFGAGPLSHALRLPIASELSYGTFVNGLLMAAALFAYVSFAALVGILVVQLAIGRESLDGSTAAVLATFSPILLLILWRWFRFVRRRHVRIGTDSVVVEGASESKTIPLALVEGTSEDARGVTLALADGRRVELPRALGGEGVRARIEDALRLRGHATSEGDDLALIERGSLSIEQWQKKLRELPLDRGEQYRERFIGREALEKVVEDAAATPEQRVAAAVILSGDASLRERLRVAAASCADDDLRRAIERAAEGELEEEMLSRATARLLVPSAPTRG